MFCGSQHEDNSAVIHIEGSCDWEPEHGIAWLVKDETVLYVGDHNDVSPYWGPEDYRGSWNYQYVGGKMPD